MLVSVIIPTFNRAHLLDRAIQSAVDQSHSKIEVIVVDDGSTDNTPSVMARWSKVARVKWITAKHEGVSAARNLGIQNAQGEYLSFLDSDDEWLPRKLSTQLELLKKENRLWCHTEEIWIRNGEKIQQRKIHQKSGGWQFLRSLQLCCISPSTVLIERSFWDRFPLGFREDFPVCEDYDRWLTLSLHEPISFVAEPMIIKYGGHSDQLSHSLKAMDQFRMKSIFDLIRRHPLHPDLRRRALEELETKYKILERGYKKHGRHLELEKIKSWREQLLNSKSLEELSG